MNGTRRITNSKTSRGIAAQVAPVPATVVTRLQAREDELGALRREKQQIQEALSQAAQIQRKLCAPREMRRGAFEIAGEMFAVRHLSGDFLKVLDLGTAVGIIVGDVAGKGICAGLWVTHLIGLSRLQLEKNADVAEATAAVNRDLCSLLSEPPMAGLFLGRLDTASGEFTYCNAGLPDALLLRNDGAVEHLNAGGPMLGAMPGAAFEAGCVFLEAGDTLLACTDGVVECRNARDDEFSLKRLASVADTAAGGSASQRLFSTLGAVLDFSSGRQLEDDLTLMVVHRRENRLVH